MAKRRRAVEFRTGDCVKSPPEHHDAGKIVGREGDRYHVMFWGALRPKSFKAFELTKAACPRWLAGSRPRKKSRRR